jgi:trehalose-phosphatase
MAQSWWPVAIERLAAATRPLVALDFDGTLAPLVDNPADSRILGLGVVALRRLAKIQDLSLALVSGRPAMDLAHLAEVPDGTYVVGSHGAEIGVLEGGAALLEPNELSPERLSRLDAIGRRLEALATAPGAPAGAWVESKPVARVLHTRQVADAAAAGRLTVQAEAAGRAEAGHVLVGKDVVEVSVVPAGKAGALRRLRALVRADLVAFAGDDVTDELALRTLKSPDVAIKVGQGPTAAEFRVANPQTMCDFLIQLALDLSRCEPESARSA